MIYKKLLIFTALIICGMAGKALATDPYVSFTYDQAGNRISRTITLPPPPQNAKRHTEATDSVVVSDKLGERSINIYPNPTRGALGVEIKGGNNIEDIMIVVFSGQGSQLIVKKADIGINFIDLAKYPEGWYILRIKAGEKHTDYKIIKQ